MALNHLDSSMQGRKFNQREITLLKQYSTVCVYLQRNFTAHLLFFFNLGYYLQICHRGRVEGEKTPRNTVTEHLLNVVLIYA